MAFSSSTVTIGNATKKSDYDRLLDNTIYLKTELAKASKGKADITISEYATTAAPDVKAKSVFENNGTLTEVTTDITPTGYSGISNSTTFYLYYDESAEAFVYLETVPTWSDVLQGWYNGNDRALFSMYKDSTGLLYQSKTILRSPNPMANFPIGFVYNQYPTKKSPSELGFTGTWTNISSSFAGDFFRSEGGNAAAFESGEQSDKVKNHTHTTVIGSHNHTVPLGNSSATGHINLGQSNASIKSVTSSSTNLGTKTSGNPTNNDIENRPVNRSIRIWERIS